MEVKSVTLISANELSELVDEKYGTKNYFCHEESANDTDYYCDCEEEDDIFDLIKDEFDNYIIEGSNVCWQLQSLVEGLIVAGHLPRTNYLVRVMW